MRKLPIPSKEELLMVYNTEISISAVARYYKTSNATVRKWMKIHGIPRLNQKESSRLINEKNTGKIHLSDDIIKKLNDKDWLYDQRINLRKSYVTIANELGCSFQSIKKFCKIHNIKAIRYNESEYSISKKLNDSEFLQYEYSNGKTLEEIANEIGTTKSTLSVWFSKHGIKTRDSNWYERKYKKVSLECQELVDFCKQYEKNILINDRKILNGLELDIVIPEKKIAIEYNGLFHHIWRPNESSFSARKDKNYHLFKTEECERQGYQLIHIFSDDWKNNNELIKSMILNKLGLTPKRIYARNCEIRKVDHGIKDKFLLENHIQGKCISSENIGLYHEGELVSIMTFNKPRFSRNHDWELMRFCSCKFTTVVGGFSKLLKYFDRGSIVTYADRTYSNGSVYEKNGFQKMGVNRPNFWYVDTNREIRYNRMKFQKSKLFPESKMSASEIMKILGYEKIWNCGTITYSK